MPHLDIEQKNTASQPALASLLNLTMLPILGFIWLVFIRMKSSDGSITHYHAQFGIKLNIIAAFSLFLVSCLMIYFGVFNQPWTWVVVIGYFTLVHTFFILLAIWALVRAWQGQQFFSKKNPKATRE